MKRYTVRTSTSKCLCSWCNAQGTYRITDNITKWTDYACKNHLKEHHKPEDLELKIQEPCLV